VLPTPVIDDQKYQEACSGVYEQGEEPLTCMRRPAIGEGPGPRLDWQRVEEIIRRKDGVALEGRRKPLHTRD
jgi:hypothetical protein